MIHFICGRAGYGKTTRILNIAAESVRAEKPTFLIVPEQHAVDAEKQMTDLLDGAPSLSLEILNFRRLCNRVFREYGGLSYSYLTDSGKSLLMWKALRETAPALSSMPGTKTDDPSLIESMLRAANEFKVCRVTPAALERSAAALTAKDNPSARTERLSAKINDLSLILADFSRLVSETADDASGDLDRAAELLREHRFFEGSDVFLDSFNGFTAQEFALIYEMMRQADDMTISLCLDPGNASAPFENLSDTYGRLIRLAKSAGQDYTVETLTENHRAKAPELAFTERNLWSTDPSSPAVYDGTSEHLRVVSCPDLFTECEAVAEDILKKVREGARWRDFAVITRGAARYDGIIDTVLEKYGVPLFFSKRTDLMSKPLVRAILTSLRIKSGNFRPSDVITYLKTGLSGIDPDNSAELEMYIERWSIRGRNRYTREWTMDPRGHGFTELPEKESARLKRVNEQRNILVPPLTAFFDKLDACVTVLDHVKALYDFLTSLDVPGTLERQAAELKREGTSTSLAESDELEQIYGVLIDALDEMASVIPETETDTDTFARLLTICLSSADIGRIPAAVDEVVAGDASLLRASRKHIYLIGANEGAFPGSPDDGGLIGDADRELLATVGIELSDSEYRAADERFHFYRAASGASETLTISYACADLAGKPLRPSSAVRRVMTLFGKEPENYDKKPLADRLEGRGKLLEYTAEAGDTALGKALRRYLEKSPETREKLVKLDIPLTGAATELDRETAELISGGDLALTQSRLDSYVLCHFSYFCKYVLKLEDAKPADFDAANIGSFIHHVLELFVSRASEGELGSLTDDDIDRMVSEIVESYMDDISKTLPEVRGTRLGHLFTKLRRSSKLLCKNIAEEFSDSEFSPAFFELPIGFSDSQGKSVAPLSVDLGDGSKAYIYGVADRVDLLRREDKLYVRVVDYKTGTKEFSMDDIAMGLNLQMLLYLFSLWKNGAKPHGALREAANGREILPAGVLYFSANVPTVTLDREESPEDVERMVSDKLARRGLLLDDTDVLTAMEHELSGKYLPVKVKKDGSFGKTDALKTLEDFGSLLSEIESTVRRIGLEIKRGNASAHPMKTKKHDACRFCEMKPVCRAANTQEKH